MSVQDRTREIERITAELAPELALQRALGRGSVATVYLAIETALDRKVAVKVLSDDLAASDVARQRFEREAKAAATVKHPNVTAIHRVGRLASDTPYIVMEHVEGRTLEDVLRARGQLAVDDCRRILASLASALAAAHRKGVVHRDLRPGNVMWEDESDRIVLMDFGLAALLEKSGHAASRLTTAGQRIGDPLHTSPEQLRGEPATEQSDIFALGVLGFELMTGSPPWKSAIDRARPLSFAGLEGRVPEVMTSLMKRCMAAQPEHRPRAQDVFETLMHEPRAHVSAGAIDGEGSGIQQFFTELRRRKVFRVLAAYIATAFLGLQGVQAIIAGNPTEGAQAFYRVLVVLASAGLPVALVLGWVFDITGGGIQRSRSAQSHNTVLQWVLPLIGLLLAVAASFGLWKLMVR